LVLLLERTHYFTSGKVLVQSVSRVRADAYELHIDLLGGATFKDGPAGAPAARKTRGRS
jgi:hypothetical protein